MATTRTRMRTPAQMFALVLGVAYFLVGVFGFFATPDVGFAEDSEAALWIFEVNPLHNIVHLAVALGYIVASTWHVAARAVNLLFGVTFLALFALGVVGLLQFLSIDGAAAADNWLHLASGLVSVYFGSVGAEVREVESTERA